MDVLIKSLILALMLVTACSFCYADESDLKTKQKVNYLFSLSFGELLEQQVNSASGIDESLADAPAAMIIITAEDIRRRGYRGFPDLLADLPGFDISVTHGAAPLVAYQRGYRTPYTQRTLFLVNGRVHNGLWVQDIITSMQYPLSQVERIEVLYGPASAVYGSNAFLGIINLITKNPSQLKDGDDSFYSHISHGSYNSTEFELASSGQSGELGYVFSTKNYHSDGPALSDFTENWGFLTDQQYADSNTWGPLLNIETDAGQLGHYGDPSDISGLMVDLSYKKIKFGYIQWDASEAFGAYYSADRAQANVKWENKLAEFYVEHQTQIAPDLEMTTMLSSRETLVNGNWAEAEPDWNPGMASFSYISWSRWNTVSSSQLFTQDFNYQMSDRIQLTAGIKYERKSLTKAYDVCSYWGDSFCSSWDGVDLGPYGLGPGIAHSSDSSYLIQPGPLSTMPIENLAQTTDQGFYSQGIWSLGKWRLNGGIRFDDNSHYGATTNPRASLIYHLSPRTSLKALYGEAFQEPAAIQLYGGWSGRQANPDLRPEKAKNLEFIAMHQSDNWLHDISLYFARYKDVIKEEAENAGEREIRGVEYRGRFGLANFIDGAEDLDGYLYYSYTDSMSSQTYDHDLAQWVDQTSELGDMAPHKLQMGVNMPLSDDWNLNLRMNYIGERELYSRNPLRAQDIKLDDYTTLDTTLIYEFEPFTLSLLVKNIFEAAYFHPGAESANSGNNFDARSLGYQNSIVPQEGRSIFITFSTRL